MFERYSEQARTTVVSAKREACRLGYSEMNPDHILLALLDDSTMLRRVMAADSVEEMHRELFARITRQGQSLEGQDIPLHSEARKVFSFAVAEADRLNNEPVGNEHLLLGILRVKGCNAARLLAEKGLTLQSVREKLTSPGTQTRRVGQGLWRSLVTRMSVRRGKDQLLMRRVSELVRKGKSRKALQLIDDFMAASVEDRSNRIKNFAPHAAVIASAIGDSQLAKRYYEQDLANNPDSLLSLYGMADLSNRQGDQDQARRYATQCYRLAAAGNDPVSQGVIELIEKRFPDLGPSLQVSGR
jgi:ATP-dependent Clp protease ATP-binding subunit ClpA